ncbi:MAG: hypothetical protein KC776_15790 [Myxococcales bacterium]|nr:hypothetical protein [Myxococcales bacterium]MCB9575757.1 hypothetical protein [Polyangiaceae bacterium]
MSVSPRWLALALLVAGCGEDEPIAPPEVPICDRLTEACGAAPSAGPAYSPPITVVPNSGMPPQVVSQVSHNNLDIAWYRGRLYFAFRTAPHHFAGTDTVLYVVSSEDQLHWRFETKLAMDTDLREPRFLVVGGRLILYFAVLGTNALAFEPQGAKYTVCGKPGHWSVPKDIFEPGFIPWRARNIDGTGYLIGYTGGENIYENDQERIDVYWLKTEDGEHFEPVVKDQPIVLHSGGSETDFAFLDDGSVVAVSRNEAGDELGWGSRICRAEAGAWGDWKCAADPKKYDSPLLFQSGSDVYLIGRRQLANDGNYDLFHRSDPIPDQSAEYEATYWKTPKRCSLWKVDPVALTVTFVLDLPGRGDTCFASALPLEDRSFLVYNYTSPLDGPDRSWLDGQQNPTLIYRTTLKLP